MNKKSLPIVLFLCYLLVLSLNNEIFPVSQNSPERKMGSMILKKYHTFQKDLAKQKFSKSDYKQKYSSKDFPVNKEGQIYLCLTVLQNMNTVVNYINSIGGIIHNQGRFEVYAWIPLDNLSEIAALEDVSFIDGTGRSYARSNNNVQIGQVTSIGDHQLLADSCRSIFYTNGSDLNGNPIKVGVISDGMQYYTNSQQSGDLPYNNFGWVTNANNYNGSEGTAMMEIIHDLAPGAGLYFGAVNTISLSGYPLNENSSEPN